MIIGVNAISHPYFLTRVLNASLWDCEDDIYINYSEIKLGQAGREVRLL